MTRLTLLTRDGCHLCDQMKAVITRLQQTYPVELTEVDGTTRADLLRQYGTEIPVLLCGDVVVAQHRITEEELQTRLDEQATSP